MFKILISLKTASKRFLAIPLSVELRIEVGDVVQDSDIRPAGHAPQATA